MAKVDSHRSPELAAPGALRDSLSARGPENSAVGPGRRAAEAEHGHSVSKTAKGRGMSEAPSPPLSRDPLTKRALELDALAAILPMDRRDRLGRPPRRWR